MNLPASGRGSKSARARRRAFTLIELLIAIAIMGMLGGFIIFGSGMLGSNRLRMAAGLVTSGVRLAIAQTNTTGRPVRLVFDLDQHRLILEETEDRMLRVKDTGDKGSEGAAAGAEAANEVEREVTEYVDGILDGPKAPRAKFRPVDKFGFDTDDPSAGRELGSGIMYRQVQTEHDEKPRADGRAYLYFWPGGGTERAAIQLYREGDDDGLTVLVSPLTGRARIERGRIELEEPRQDVDFDVREEE